MVKAKVSKESVERLLPTQRQSFILDVLTERGAVSLQQLAERLGASFSTVRRDLDELVRRKLVERKHGGAVLAPGAKANVSAADGSPTSRAMRNAKESIGRLAATRIREGDTVIFDSSTTVLEAARTIVESRIRITAVTNNVKIADLLGSTDAIRLIVPGGTRRPGTHMLAGEPGDTFFSHLHVDVALLGAQSASGGMLTDSRLESAGSKRSLLKAGRTKILLIDSWKFGGPGFCDVVPLTEFDEVITDDGLDPEVRRDLERRGILVHIGGEAAEAAIAASQPEVRRSKTAALALIDSQARIRQ